LRCAINVAVWGNYLEDFDQTITFEMNDPSHCGNIHLMQGSIARMVRVDVTVALESS
jgi:hypothetical protein